MPKRKKDINDLREYLDELWMKTDAKGRCWEGKENQRSPLAGSHITLIHGDELVSIFERRKKKGEYAILQFTKVASTQLGREIENILISKGVKFSKM